MAAAGGAALSAGQTLTAWQSLKSPNGEYSLVMQSDGNLVLYFSSGRPLWQSGTYNHPGAYAVMQADGNLVVYGPGGWLWQTGTYNQPGDYLALQDDANLVVYSPSGPLWATHTTNSMLQGSRYEALFAGQYLESWNSQYRFLMQTDGNLVLYGPSGWLWQSGTYNHPGSYAVMQSDGNLVVYGPNGWLWQSATYNHPGSGLYFQDDGNLLVMGPNGPLWATGTIPPGRTTATSGSGSMRLVGPNAIDVANTGADLVVAYLFDAPATPHSLQEYQVTIAWGDGLTSTGLVSRDTVLGVVPGAFSIHGGHVYGALGYHHVTITVAKPSWGVTVIASGVVHALHHYVIDLKAWIPQPAVVDPGNPLGIAVLSPWCGLHFAASSVLLGNGYTGFDDGKAAKDEQVVTFDWDGANVSNFSSIVSPGISTRVTTYSDFGPSGSCNQAKLATDTGSHNVSGSTISMEIQSSMPLFPSPAIHAVVNASLAPDGTISIKYQTTFFPSIGMKVLVDGTPSTAVVNDVSCLSNESVLGPSGVGLLTRGLLNFNNTGDGVVVSPNSPGQTRTLRDWLLCG